MDATQARKYSTRRRAIVQAVSDALQQINGAAPFRTSVHNIEPRLKFWDEVTDFPAIHIGAGAETREYEGGGFRFRYLRLTVRCYVQDNDDVIAALEELLEDVETVLLSQPTKIEDLSRRNLDQCSQVASGASSLDSCLMGMLCS